MPEKAPAIFERLVPQEPGRADYLRDPASSLVTLASRERIT
jgi:hypothetical protein